MRKQTKLVAVLSTAALLAIGASMTSFAAQGWAEEDGTWVYYNKDGGRVTESWKKSGDNWYYLDESGEMATDMLIEDDNNTYYYVDENGTMVTNQWVAIENEDYDGSDDEPSSWWYYFQSNGKALKGSDNGNVSLKTVNGKKYCFDDEGKMLYGWVNTNGERETGDDAWTNADYYFGDENDGAMTVGWILLNITDDNATDQDNGNVLDTAYEDEDQDRWFYFKTNGKKMTNETGKTINGRKYGFDSYGRMYAEWSMNAAYATPGQTSAVATDGSAVATSSIVTGARSEQWRYYGSPEDVARITKGWFKVVPAKGLNASKYNDDEDKWYYSDNDGKLVANEFKTIKGKKYAFDEKGGMIDGLKFISVLKNDKNTIIAVHDDDWYDTEDEFDLFANGEYQKSGETPVNFNALDATSDYVTYCYYFGDGNDGSVKTGKQTVDIDGDDFSFNFNKSGGTKGAGKSGVDDDKYYLNGKLLKADKEDKYSVIKVEKDATGNILKLHLLTTDEYLSGVSLGGELTADVSNVSFNGKTYTQKKGNSYYQLGAAQANTYVSGTAGYEFYLVNTSGKVETKDKSKAKDGNDICYTVDHGKIVAVYEEN